MSYSLDSSFEELAPLINPAVQRIKERTESIDDYTLLIGILPIWAFDSYFSWIPTTEDEIRGAKTCKERYFYKSQWLNYLLSTQAPWPGLFISEAVFLKTEAEFLKSVKDLASELLLRFPEELQTEACHGDTSSADIMLCAAIQRLTAKLYTSGLVTGVPILEATKDEVHDSFEILFQNLGGKSKRQGKNKILTRSPRIKSIPKETQVPVLDLISHLAKEAIKDEPKFKNNSSLRTFREHARKIGVRLRYDKNVWADRYDDGVLRPAGRNGRRNPQIVTKTLHKTT